MRRAMLLSALALSACGGSGDAPRDAAQAAAVAQCRSQAIQDPAMQALIERANSPLQEVRVEGVHDQEVAMRIAVQHCLAARSGQPVGGVEPVQGGWLGPPLL